MNPVRRGTLFLCAGAISLSLLSACSRPVQNPPAQENAVPITVRQLTGRIWKIEQPLSGFLGSIYVFLQNGTLLETSCKETYRIAKWSTDADSRTIQVVEDGQPAFTATILEAGPENVRLQRKLRHGETDELKLTAMTGEFVCPDLRQR